MTTIADLFLLILIYSVMKPGYVDGCKKNNKKIKYQTKADCQDYADTKNNRGIAIYHIQPKGTGSPFEVVCNILDGKGWTVIQTRQDNKLTFDRGWTEYKNGFGQLSNSFWLGNEKIHLITRQSFYKMRVLIELHDGRHRVSEYPRFWVDGESKNYTLNVQGRAAGSAGDLFNCGIKALTGAQFATPDRDTTRNRRTSCAGVHRSGWWFNEACASINLNHQYPHYFDCKTSTFYRAKSTQIEVLRSKSGKFY